MGRPFAKLVGMNFEPSSVWIQNRGFSRGDYAAESVEKGVSKFAEWRLSTHEDGGF